MKLEGRRRSDHVEDRRGQSPGVPGGFGGSSSGGFSGGGGNLIFLLLRLLMGGGKGGLGLVLILLLALFFIGRGCPLMLAPDDLDHDSRIQVTQVQEQPQVSKNGKTAATSPEKRSSSFDDQVADLLSVVLASTEDIYTELFKGEGLRYHPPTLVLYDAYVQSACGFSSAATGPFYCPADKKVYIDTSFFKELSQKYGASGDFAMAYVLAHEIGHHVQNELGVSEQVQKARQTASKTRANQLSVRLELQADYLAGLWAHYEDKIDSLDEGDVEEAIQAAGAIGDDRLQKQAQGYVVPDSFTHGSSKQRVSWFMRGFKEGTLADGDTFSIPYDQLRLPDRQGVVPLF